MKSINCRITRTERRREFFNCRLASVHSSEIQTDCEFAKNAAGGDTSTSIMMANSLTILVWNSKDKKDLFDTVRLVGTRGFKKKKFSK